MPAHPRTHGGASASTGSSSPELPEDVARAVVLHRLSFGPRTRAQLRDAVLAKGVPAEVADRVLDRLTEVGLVDDADFAAEWVRSRHRSKGLSRQALASELRRKGVSDSDAGPALDALDGDEERATAEALVREKLSSSRGLEPRKRAARLVAMLARKGYGGEVAGDVVRAALAAEHDKAGWGADLD